MLCREEVKDIGTAGRVDIAQKSFVEDNPRRVACVISKRGSLAPSLTSIETRSDAPFNPSPSRYLIKSSRAVCTDATTDSVIALEEMIS